MASWLSRLAARLAPPPAPRDSRFDGGLARIPPPQFFVPGTQKGGTTSLFFYLKRHPGVVLSNIKEYFFFDQHYEKGLSWYEKQLPQLPAGANVITGDFTPIYLFYPRAVERIARHFPRARIIVLLRNPVDRAFSHYHHEVRLGTESRSFDTAIADEPEVIARELQRIEADEHYFSLALSQRSYLSRGYYADQLQRLFRHYAREQVLALQSERLFDDPQAVLEQVYKFLDLEPTPPGEFKAHNEHHYGPMEPVMRRRLVDHYKAPNERLFELLGERYAWD